MAASLHSTASLQHACPSLRPRRCLLTPPVPSATLRCRFGSPLWFNSGSRRLSQSLAIAASPGDSRSSNIGEDNEQSKSEDVNAQEQWKQSLEHFKSEALKVKAMSVEVYAVYSKKAMEILLQTSDKLKIQADQAQMDLAEVVKEISEEGQQYINMAAENSPDSIKDVAETFRSLPELRGLGDFEDYHIGIPYGTYLTVGGFIDFMLTGSIPAIRFGIILGGALLVLSISSLRSTRSGKRSPLLLKGQTAIASIIFLRQMSILFQKGLFALFPAVISGAVAVFYIYYMLSSYQQRGSSMGRNLEN